ncbi:MAG: hypothetical protein R6V00_11185, partial [Candidatus Aminicenantes bacterium]
KPTKKRENLPSVSIDIEAVIADHNLSFVRDVRGYTFKPVFIFLKEWLKIMEENAVKNCALRMTLTIYSAHGRDSDSRNVPVIRND